jgi:trehalose 6-phosphate phosphatase
MTADLPSALAAWPEIERRLAGRRLALFLDYDGTLTPIVARPELALLPPDMGAALARLARRHPLAILSGRARPDVAALVGLDGIVYAGSHGLDLAGPPPAPGAPPLRLAVGEGAPERQLAAAAARLAAELSGLPGVLIDPKRFALAIHYRLASPADLPRIERAVDEAAAAFPALRQARGKKVFELRPALDWHKGATLAWLLDRWSEAAGAPGGGSAPAAGAGASGDRGASGSLDTHRGTGESGPAAGAQATGGAPRPWLPIYIGDDVTDEDAFAAAAERGGIGILVAEEPRATAARYRLHDPGEVRLFLERLAELPAGGAGLGGDPGPHAGGAGGDPGLPTGSAGGDPRLPTSGPAGAGQFPNRGPAGG